MIVYLNDDQVVAIKNALKFYEDRLDKLEDSEAKWHFNHFIIKTGFIEHLEKDIEEYNYPGTKL